MRFALPYDSGSLKLILPYAYFGKHLRGLFARHADAGRDFRNVGAEERVRELFLTDGDGDGRLAFGKLLRRLRLARRQRLVVRLDGAGEFDVGGGVFVAAEYFGVVRQIAQLQQRTPHHAGRALDDAAAADREQRVADEGELVAVKPIGDVAAGVARRFDHIGGQLADGDFVALAHGQVDAGNFIGFRRGRDDAAFVLSLSAWMPSVWSAW
jgi:hypothetical protein